MTRDHLPALRAVIAATDLFPAEMLGEMAAGFLDGDAEGETWVATDDGNGPFAVAYHVPEQLTEGTWDLLAIAVDPARRGDGHGSALVRHVEGDLAARGARCAGAARRHVRPPAEFARTRGFYAGAGYDEESRIHDPYDVGEDEVTFPNALS